MVLKKLLVVLAGVFAIPLLFVTVAATSAYATCYICGGSQWTGQCLSASSGGSICTIGQGGGGACNVYGSCCENCGCSWGCAGPWCCTDGKASKKKCPTLKESSFTIGETIFAAPQTTLQPQQRYDSTFGFKEFMA